ncbi:MAG: DoxX family membrane protein [Patescibacteria group bacterium]
METAFLVGRIIFGGYFIMSGVNHFMKLDMMAGYAGSKGVPQAKFAVASTGVLLVLGGLGVVLGVLIHASLLALAIFIVGVTPMMHQFWKITDPMQKMGEQINFMKNAALFGAVLMLYMIALPWPLSIAF